MFKKIVRDPADHGKVGLCYLSCQLVTEHFLPMEHRYLHFSWTLLSLMLFIFCTVSHSVKGCYWALNDKYDPEIDGSKTNRKRRKNTVRDYPIFTI